MNELPLPVRSFKDPPILSGIISSDLDESQSYFGAKDTDFRRSAEDWHPCMNILVMAQSGTPTVTNIFVFGSQCVKCLFIEF